MRLAASLVEPLPRWTDYLAQPAFWVYGPLLLLGLAWPARRGDLALPLVAMNPMGKDHVPALIDAYLALDAERVAAEATAEAAKSVEGGHGAYTVCLVVSDDLKGGWTHIHNVTARRLRGAWYGVIGLGRIGTASALRARARDMLTQCVNWRTRWRL